MRSHIGVSIDSAELRAILVQSGAVQWYSWARLEARESLGDAVRALLADAPRPARGLRTTVALSRTWVQAKPLPGFPTVKPARLANQLLRENEQSFFLSTGRARVIVGVHIEPDGTPWGAAFDADVLDELVRAVRSARLGRVRLAPVAVVLSAVTRTGDENVPPALQSIGEDAAPYFVAYAAAVAPRRLPLAWSPARDPGHARRWTMAGRLAAGAAIITATAFATLSPAIRAARSTRAIERQIARLRPEQAEIQRNEIELMRVTGTLNRIAAFSASRGEVTRLLAALTRAIPESTALLTVRIDSVDGAFTAVAPRVADVLPELVAERDIVAPRIVGSMTREMMGGVQVERAAFRFRRRAAPTRR